MSRLRNQRQAPGREVFADRCVAQPVHQVDQPLVHAILAEHEVRRSQRLVQLVEVEVGRVVDLQGDAGQVGTAPGVLRWSGSATGHGDRGRSVGRCRQDLLQAERQLPVVAVVVEVVQDVARLLERLVETYVGGRDAALVVELAFLGVVRAEKELAGAVERVPAEGEPVQMRVGPVERDLHQLVDGIEREVGPHVQSTPDRRLGAVEINPNPEDLKLVKGRPAQLGPHAAQRSLPTEQGQVARRIDFNPAQHVHLPDANRPKVIPWEPAELGQFLDHVAGHRFGALFEVMAATGLRRGEALGLRWSDIELELGVIVVRRQLVQVGSEAIFAAPKTRSGENRIVELDSRTLRALHEYRLRQVAERQEWGSAYIDDGLVFTRHGGQALSPEYVTRLFPRLAKEAGLRPIRLHDLRHGAASLRLAAGVEIAAVSKMLGHSSIAITADTYSHLLRGVGRQAAEAAMSQVPRGNPQNTGVPMLFPQEPKIDSGPSPDWAKGQVRRGAPSGTRTPNPPMEEVRDPAQD
jgi:integrase